MNNKKYENFLDKMQGLLDNARKQGNIVVPLEELENAFPELKESEDEKVRKAILRYFESQTTNNVLWNVIGLKQKQVLAWLEKQEGCELIRKEWLEHIKQSWYKEGFIDGKYSGGTSKEWTMNDTTTLNELIDFLENGKAKLQHDLTRYANWLKIQLAPKVEPKFNVGEWVVREFENGYKEVGQIIDIKFQCDHNNGKVSAIYYVRDINGNLFNDGIDYFVFENDLHLWHLWSIADAKEGDVLVGDYDNCRKPWIGIFKCLTKNRPDTQFDSYCFISSSKHNFKTPESEGFYNPCTGHTIRYAKPATKEQRDILFQKMKEAGYEWNNEKKVLEKFEPKFHKGDWITDGENICYVLSVSSKQYELHIYNKYYCHITTITRCIDEKYRIWSIQDAKDGDVITTPKGSIFIFKEISDFTIYDHCGLYNNVFFLSCTPNGISASELPNDYKPATEEEHHTLIQRINEAGYSWDAEKKELVTLERIQVIK